MDEKRKEREEIWLIRLLNLSLTVIIGTMFFINGFLNMHMIDAIIISIVIITFSLITVLLFLYKTIKQVQGIFLMGIFGIVGFIFIYGVLFYDGVIKYFIISIGVFFIIMALIYFNNIFVKKIEISE